MVLGVGEHEVMPVGEHGRRDLDHVIHKLYVSPAHRGPGLGCRIVDALADLMPADVDEVFVEHFVRNLRAASFYEREGFRVRTIQPGPAGSSGCDVVWRPQLT